ncbi:MAG: alpha/beta hydrolase [Xanthobacteraceae bacterium]
MNFAAAVLAIVVLGATPALSAGFEQVMVPDPSGAPLEVGIWYPSEAPATSQPLGPFEQTVAIGGAVAGHGLPLVVMSHGTGGSFTGHYDTALALVEAGFVVAAVTHTGDNYRERTLVGRPENRPRHIKILIDYMLAAWRQHDTIDPSRISMFGFSAGGFTALVAIGGTPDMSTVAPYCAAHPDEWTCRMIKDRNIISVSADTTGQSRTVPDWVHDPRIAAAVIASPALGYAFSAKSLSAVTVPIQLWRGDSDEILPHPNYAQAVYDRLSVKPEYHVVPNAGHFAFLAPCTPSLAAMVPEICHDPEHFDRTAFHREFNPAVVAFFRAKLPAH